MKRAARSNRSRDGRPGRAPPRRGVALAVAVILLTVCGLATLSAVSATADDSYAASLRVEAMRAVYAAESGLLAGRERRASGAPALTGTVQVAPGASYTVVQPFGAPPGPAGTLIVEGACGRARVRRSVNGG